MTYLMCTKKESNPMTRLIKTTNRVNGSKSLNKARFFKFQFHIDNEDINQCNL